MDGDTAHLVVGAAGNGQAENGIFRHSNLLNEQWSRRNAGERRRQTLSLGCDILNGTIYILWGNTVTPNDIGTRGNGDIVACHQVGLQRNA